MSSKEMQPTPAADRGRGQYSDGAPLDEVQYLEFKLILKPDRFTSAKVFLEFGDLVARIAKTFGIGFVNHGLTLKPEIREVAFLDTADFRLYNNAFILRRRIPYEDHFPRPDPEVVFKFRHPDLQRAAELDVRPKMPGKYRVKFKAEVLPLKDKTGGLRMLYSHNVQFPLSQAPEGDRKSMATLAQVFPALSSLKCDENEQVHLVNSAIVEEVLQDLGTLDFGKGIAAASNIAIWRERGTHHTMCGEYAFQAKFKRLDDLHQKTMERCRQFFIALQQPASDWLSLGTTKTGLVYRLKGNAPQGHE